MLNLAVHAPPPKIASKRLWRPVGALQTHIVIFEEIKAPAGALKTRICIFEENKSPCGSAKDRYLYF